VLAAASQYGDLTGSVVGRVAGSAVVVLSVLLAALPLLGRWYGQFWRARMAGPNASVPGWRLAILEQAEHAAIALDTTHLQHSYRVAMVHSVLT
jgi:hypothetical protein